MSKTTYDLTPTKEEIDLFEKQQSFLLFSKKGIQAFDMNSKKLEGVDAETLIREILH